MRTHSRSHLRSRARARTLVARLFAVAGVSTLLLLFSPITAQAAAPCSSPSYDQSAAAGDPCAPTSEKGAEIATAAEVAGAAAPVAAAALGGLGQGGAASLPAAAAPLAGAPTGTKSGSTRAGRKSKTGGVGTDPNLGQPVGATRASRK